VRVLNGGLQRILPSFPGTQCPEACTGGLDLSGSVHERRDVEALFLVCHSWSSVDWVVVEMVSGQMMKFVCELLLGNNLYSTGLARIFQLMYSCKRKLWDIYIENPFQTL
jgi:hypothetical protein